MKVALFLTLFFASLGGAAAENLVILGGGPAGLSAALFAGQAYLSPLVLTGSEGGLASLGTMENIPGFPEGIQGKELAEKIQAQAEKFGVRFQANEVVAADLSRHPFKLTLNDGRLVETEALILALGSQKRHLGIDSEALLKGKGVYDSTFLTAPLFQNQEMAVIGGGDAAMEEALHLAEYAHQVTLILRGNRLQGSAYLQERILSQPKIKVISNAVVEEILDPSQDSVTGLLLRDERTGDKALIACDGLVVSIGSRPNTDLFKGQLTLTSSGHIQVEPPSSRTNLPGVFAAGDVMDPSYRKAAVAFGAGCIAALDAKAFLNSHQLDRLFVGELQEKWQFPSDHLPIGISILDGRASFSFVTWNVLNAAYMHWIDENGQGLAHSLLTQENVKIREDGLTLRDQHVIDRILEMTHSAKHLFCFQECSEPFIQQLAAQIPPHFKIIRSFDKATKNQNIVLYDETHFQFLEQFLHENPCPSEPGRPLQEVLFESNGRTYQIFNAHLRCDSAKTHRFELAQFVKARQKMGNVVILTGDLNVNQYHMKEALNDPNFLPYTPYKTTVSPELYSKAVDHIFINRGEAPLQITPLAPNEVLEDLQRTVNLLSF